MSDMTVDEVIAERDACLERLGKRFTAARSEGDMGKASHLAEDMAKLMLPPNPGTGTLIQDWAVQYALEAGEPDRACMLVALFCKAPGSGEKRQEQLKALLPWCR